MAVLHRVDAERQRTAKREQEAAIQREADRRRQEEADRRRRVEEERKQEEARVQNLIAAVTRWRQSKEIKAYLEEVARIRLERGHAIDPGSELGVWMRWAADVAQRLDPLAPREN